MNDLQICRVMGWTYADVAELPADVYDVLIAELPRWFERPE